MSDGEQRPGEPAESRTAPAAALIAAVAAVLLFLILLLDATRGHFVPQVVDLNLVLQYARAMAEGHPFQYNPGEPPTTGATSLLHTALLALPHALGARGEGLVALAILLGAALYLVSVVLAFRVARLLAGGREAQLAALLVALGGPVVWSYLYGSDIALFMCLSLWLLERLLAEWRGAGPRWGIVAATSLALSRPEGLPIALGVGAAWWLGPLRGRSAMSRARAWLPAAAGIAVLLLYKVLTGAWLGSSFADKSLVANYGLAASLALAAEYYTDLLRGVLLGFYPSQTPIGFARGWAPFYLPPLALVAALAALAAAPAALRTPLRLWCGLVTLVCAAVTPNTFMGVHFNRYALWAFPTLLALTGVGIGVLSNALARGDAALDRRLFAIGAALAVLFGGLSTLRFAVAYGEMGGQIWIRDIAAAQWIRANLPPGVAIANAATSVEYLTGHRNMNLHGVTSPAFLGTRTAEREAGMFEALGRLAPEQRPPFLISSDSMQETQATLRALADGPPLFRTTSFADELVVHRTRWDAIGQNASMHSPAALAAVAGLEEVDRLNVCDARDEAQHRYRFRSRLGHLELNGTPRGDVYLLAEGERPLIDAGRAILGYESFEVRARPGRDLIVVMRTAAEAEANLYTASGSRRVGLAFAEAGMRVHCDGQPLPNLSFRPGAGWIEQLLRIPGDRISGDRIRLELRGRYASYFYWFFQ